jgi:hypothetical protein
LASQVFLLKVPESQIFVLLKKPKSQSLMLKLKSFSLLETVNPTFKELGSLVTIAIRLLRRALGTVTFQLKRWICLPDVFPDVRHDVKTDVFIPMYYTML